MSQSFFVVIMAGGAGTRFWPRSRRRDPKQTLPFLGGKSLLQRTVDRLRPAVEPEDFLIVAGEDQIGQIRRQLPELPPSAFLAEPMGRNTAPCIALAAHVLACRDASKPILVVPADHHIGDADQWLAVMKAGAQAAAEVRGRSVVYGVCPTSPHTGYGYVNFGQEKAQVSDRPVHEVLGFREKPDKATAQTYLDAGNYYWNSGCFAWRPDTFLDLVARFMPALAEVLSPVQLALETGMDTTTAEFTRLLERVYPTAPSESVDFGIMELAQDIVGLSLDVGWNDVGSWPALFDVISAGPEGNLDLSSDSILIDCADTLVWGENQLVAAVGVKDLLIIQSKGAVLICPRSQAQRVKEVVNHLRDQGRSEFL